VNRRYAFPLEGVPPGRYVVELEVTTARDDIRRELILPAETITRSVALDVP
jgi:hypothetical protein